MCLSDWADPENFFERLWDDWCRAIACGSSKVSSKLSKVKSGSSDWCRAIAFGSSKVSSKLSKVRCGSSGRGERGVGPRRVQEERAEGRGTAARLSGKC